MSPRLHPFRQRPLFRFGSRTHFIHCTVSSFVLSNIVAYSPKATCTSMTKRVVCARFRQHGQTSSRVTLLWRSPQVDRHCMAVLYSNWLNWLSVLRKRTAMIRKDNYAACEKVNMPKAAKPRRTCFAGHCTNILYIKDRKGYICKKGLAVHAYKGVNIFTYETHRIQRQNSSFASQRYAQYQLRESSRSTFPGGGVFRSTRLDAGQIRDAASGSEGRHGHFDRGIEFWNVSPIILQSAARFRAKRDAWANSQATWSEKTSQADAGDLGVRDSDSSAGAASENFGTDRATSEEVWHPRSSQIIGKSSVRCEKKTAPTLGMGGGRGCQALAPVLIDRYEWLRHHALSRCIFPEMRPGYGVLVARGVAAWLDVAEEVTKPLHPPYRSTEAAPTTVPPQLHDDLVRVMGEVVMTLTAKGAL